MPTNIAPRSASSRRTASGIREILQSDELTTLLLWTAAGLALFLCLAALGLQPETAADWVMVG